MEILLERSYVNPCTIDTFFGRTPLSWAAENRHEEIVRILLEPNDVDPNTADGYGQVPFSWAARNEHDRTARLL